MSSNEYVVEQNGADEQFGKYNTSALNTAGM